MQVVATKYYEYGQREIGSLTRSDPTLGAAMARIGKLERVVMPDLFAALVHAIVGQLVSAKAAHAVWVKLQERFDAITAPCLAAQSADDIQRCGMTNKKAVCIRNIADMIARGALRLDELRELSDEDVVRKLTALDGVGRWTAEMMLIHALERRDVVSWGDIAIRRGMMKLYGLSSLTKSQFDTYRRRYAPYGSVASIYLWHISFE